MRVLGQLAQLVQARYSGIGGRRAGRPVWEAVEPARVGEDAAGGSLLQHGGGNACCRLIPPMSPGRQGCGRRPAQSSRRPGGPRRGRPASDPRRAGRPQATALQRGSAWDWTPAGLPGGEAHTVDARNATTGERSLSVRSCGRPAGGSGCAAPRTYEWLGPGPVMRPPWCSFLHGSCIPARLWCLADPGCVPFVPPNVVALAAVACRDA